MMLEKTKTDYSGRCPWCKNHMSADMDCYSLPVGSKDVFYLCSHCGSAYNEGFEVGKLATEADKTADTPKPDDGGPECPEYFQKLKKHLTDAGVVVRRATSFWMWAATILKVPCSGDKRLDDMIRESRRLEGDE